MRCRNTIAFPEWQARHVYAEGDLVRWSGGRYRVAKKMWRGDRGLDWNHGRYEVGDEIVNIEGTVYRCTAETDPARMWPSVTTAPPALRTLLAPGDGAQHPAAGSFAWALSQSWQPPLLRNDALTSPTPFGVATRQWLLEKRNEAATPAVGKLGALWHRHLVMVTLLGAVATARRIRRRVTSPVPARLHALAAALTRSDSVAPANRKFGPGLRDRLGRATLAQRHRRT